MWIPDVFAEQGCPRLEVARRSGLRNAFAVPVRVEGEVLGVLEFFDRDMPEPHRTTKELIEAAGTRIALFLKRCREEKRHRATIETLQAVLRFSPLAIGLVDLDLTVKYMNPAAERLFGWKAEEMVGLPYTLVVPPDRREEFRRYVQVILEGRELIGVESWRLRKDGTPVNVSISAAPVRDARGEITGILAIFIDLSRREPV